MYLVLAFDMNDTSNVSLKCLTENLDLANKTYDNLNFYYKDIMIELIQVDNNFNNSYTLYWGTPVEGIKILKSNNRVFE